MTTSKINIGITIGITSKKETMWINGIKMNAIFLLDALMQSDKNYNVYLINTNQKFKVSDPEVKLPWDTSKYKIYDYLDIFKETDLLIMLGTNLAASSIKEFKSFPVNNLEKKVISYKCGNNYVIEMERAIFADDDADRLNLAPWSYASDDVWMVPQQEYQNKHYYDLFEGVDSKSVPFVWHPMFIDELAEAFRVESNVETNYAPDNKEKRIVSFEPNMNVVKYSMIPTLIVESLYRKRKDFLNYYAICSGMRIGKRTGFVSHMKMLEIFIDKKLKVDGRYPMPFYLAERTDVVVSHQWENPLNYAYLDALHFNYPLVHNAEMVQDAGYFYRDFNIKEGAEQLERVINEHDSNLEEYNRQCDLVKSRYMAERNKGIVETYDKLIENIWEPGKHNMSYEYDWQTNLYK